MDVKFNEEMAVTALESAGHSEDIKNLKWRDVKGLEALLWSKEDAAALYVQLIDSGEDV